MRPRTAVLLLVLVSIAVLAASTLGESARGVPVLYRGSLIGCADQPSDIVAELLACFGDKMVYFFGIKGCPECTDMEQYLENFLPSGLAYVDVVEYSNLFTRLLNYLSKYVEDEYLKEVPLILVKSNTSVTVISIGVFRDDSYWRSALLGVNLEECEVRLIKPPSRDSVKLIAGALVLGAMSALSPCVLYLYTTMLLSYTTYDTKRSLPRLLSFVLGLGLGYFLVVIGLYSLLWLLKPFTWVFFLAFGFYMVLHSRGVLGCLVGGRACRDVNYTASGKLLSLLSSFFPFLLGVVASVSATPCSAGYFVLLQSTFATDAGPLVNAIIFAYLVAYVMPYILLSILSSRFLGLVDRFLSKASLVEFLGGIVLISVGAYLALSA